MKCLDFSFILLIVGSIIGVGFSSGQEIWAFFSSYGIYSYFIIILSSIFLYFIVKSLTKFGRTTNSKNIKDINKILFKNDKLFNALMLIGLFIFVCAMVAGLNSIGTLIFKNIRFPIFTIISLFFAFFICQIGYNAIKRVNNILMPVVVILLIFVAIFNLVVEFKTTSFNDFNFLSLIKCLLMGLCYISYNIVFSSSLIVENSNSFNKKQAKYNSLIISLILGGLIFIINLALINSNVVISKTLPMLSLAFNINNVVGYVFGFILWFSVLTSLISSLYILVNNFKMNKFLSSAIILTLSFVFSSFGFNSIVNFVYPIQGVIGLIFIFKVFKFNIKQQTRKIKKPKIIGFYSKL